MEVIYEVAKANYDKVCDANQHLQFNTSYILVAIGVMITLMVSSIIDIDSVWGYLIAIPLVLLFISLYLSVTSIFSRTKLCNTACVEDLRNHRIKEIYVEMINVYEYLTEDVRWYWKCRSTLAVWSKCLLLLGVATYILIIITIIVSIN